DREFGSIQDGDCPLALHRSAGGFPRRFAGRGCARAPAYRRRRGEQQRAQLVGGPGAGNLRPARHRCADRSDRGGPTLVASLLTGEIQAAFTSGVSVLGAAAQGVEMKMLTSIASRVSWKLIANPQIKNSAELRGKRFGVQSIVGSTWMYAMLALEQLGLEPKRDRISFVPIGDPVTIGHALEAGRIDAAVLDPPLSRQLAAKGFALLVDLAQTDASFPGLGAGV